jgi:ABC-2 type transport system permease protein
MSAWLRRHLGLVWIQARLSVLLAMQYRWNFLLDGLMSAFWTVTALVPLTLVFQERPVIAGWTYGEALVVVAFFTLLEGILEGAINPSLSQVVEHIRSGTLDFVLLKPADAQVLVSSARILPFRVFNFFAAAGLFVYAFVELGQTPSWAGVGMALVLLLAGISVLYSVWIVVVAIAFRAVRLDNLQYFFKALFDAARWPATVFKGFWAVLFTFIVPVALMTTYPAEALLGRLSAERAATGLGLAFVFAFGSRWIWRYSIRWYTSASS